VRKYNSFSVSTIETLQKKYSTKPFSLITENGIYFIFEKLNNAFFDLKANYVYYVEMLGSRFY
jgi:hypothetical protein